MWFTFPYRIKNPPERTPYVTFVIIGLNVIVYLFTTRYFLEVRQDALDALAVAHSNLSPWRLVTAMFLHENLEHIAGNMWFLWLFGAALEGRLGPWKYLGLYFASGIAGGLLNDVVFGVHHPDIPSLGASGAIMGVMGGYLYTFPYAPVVFFWFRWWIIPAIGVREWHAIWAVLYWIVVNDILRLMLFGSRDPIGHFAHIGGFLAGLLACAMFGVKRDTREYSEANAMKTDLGNVEYLSYYELETMLRHGVTDARVLTEYCEKALMSPGSMGELKCFQVFQAHLPALLQGGDPYRVASILLRQPAEYLRQLPPRVIVQIGSNLEHATGYEYASRVYRRLYEVNPSVPETEVALNRAAHIAQSVLRDPMQARHFYEEQLRLFPHGHYVHDAHHQLSGLPALQRGPFM